MKPVQPIVETILQRYNNDPCNLIMILQDIQAELHYLPEEAINCIAQELKIPRTQIYSVSSFYKCFSLEELGRHKIDVCTGTACHVRGAPRLLEQISGELGLKPGETSADKEMTLTSVNCVGACALGPVVVIDGEYHGKMTPAKLSKAVKQCCSKPGVPCKNAAHAGVTHDTKQVKKLTSPAAVAELRESLLRQKPLDTHTVLICAGTGCIANGSLQVAAAFEQELAKQKAGIQVEIGVKKTGCHGFCEKGPLVILHPQGTFYTNVKVADVKEIVEKTVMRNEVVPRLLYKDPEHKTGIEEYRRVPFYAKQQRTVLRNIGHIDPESIEDYIQHGGYGALVKALGSADPAGIITEIERSGLRGRGGGGFATGKKWRSCAQLKSDVRYLVCNGDEGDPGAFMDRSIMEGDPFAVIEGMTIGAYAIGAAQGYIYVREEYPLAVQRLKNALAVAEQWGLLGRHILGSDFSFSIHISRGGGAFVCGESTALMQSLAGKIGEPRAKYIRSVEKGLFDRPTVLNNVETFATVPLIIVNGSQWFASIGTEKSKGTKAFAVVGKVKNTGLVEVPMGTTLRSIIYETCGGILDDRPFKAVQTGGPSGGCLPASKLDLPVDFDTLTKEGSMMGSGGMIVMDDATCMVDVARYFTDFLSHESCGKCAACRLGLDNLKEILERICAGRGTAEDIPAMEKIFAVLDDGALCGLGKSAANPVRSTLVHFRDEYLAHITDKKCPAGVCRSLITYTINEQCTGCGACAQACPKKAISGSKKERHIINTQLCNRCGVCVATCNFNAVVTVK